MVDSFYNNYTKALKKENVGKFTRGQLTACWTFVGLMVISGIAIFIFGEIKNTKGMLVSIVVYIASVIILNKLLDLFEKKRSRELEITAHKERKNALIETINQYLGKGKYGAKIDFFVMLYERAIKQREEREKLFRRIGIGVITAIGTISVNAINAPENTSWQYLFVLVIVAFLWIGLAVAPFYFPAAFDQRKKVYYYMIVELQAVKFLMSSVLPDDKIQKKVKNGMSRPRPPQKTEGPHNTEKRK